MACRVILISALFFGLMNCSPNTSSSAVTPGDCRADAIGVERTITLDLQSPPLDELLREGEVVLTFDDGPHSSRTSAILDLLASECTQAAFFLRGDKAALHGDLVRQISEQGHALGGHGWAHSNLTKMTPTDAEADISRGRLAIDKGLGTVDGQSAVELFRFPYVARTEELSALLKDMGLIDINVSTDGRDWTGMSAEEGAERILAGLESRDRRGIILLHDPFAGSLERTRILLEKLKANDYRVVGLN